LKEEEELRPASGRAGATIGASKASRTPECGASPMISVVRSPFAGSPGGGTLPLDSSFIIRQFFLLTRRWRQVGGARRPSPTGQHFRGRADPPWSAHFSPEAEAADEMRFLREFSSARRGNSRRWRQVCEPRRVSPTILKSAGRGGPVLPRSRASTSVGDADHPASAGSNLFEYRTRQLTK